MFNSKKHKLMVGLSLVLRPLRQLVSGVGIASLLVLSPAVLAAADKTSQPCDDIAFQAIITPAASELAAKAYWLNAQTIQWPGAPADGVFKLYVASGPGIVANKSSKVTGAQSSLTLTVSQAKLPDSLNRRFAYVPAGVRLDLPPTDTPALRRLQQQSLVLVHEDANGTVIDATRVQIAGALDDLYRHASTLDDFGVRLANTADGKPSTRFRVWAPTAQKVTLCIYKTGDSAAEASHAMQWDDASGSWFAAVPKDLTGHYYKYAVDVLVPNLGRVLNRVTDPYSISLTADSHRSYIANLDNPTLKPSGWDDAAQSAAARAKVVEQTDMSIYELHVRDFSANDASVPAAHRGKYLAFTDLASNGMRHLKALSDAGMTDIHLLPAFDFGSVPEVGCVTPKISGAADSDAQQAAAKAVASQDCFNWGYDPVHYGAPEGSYASDARDGAKRIVEFRQMVQALHRLGLRVGMDVVYNHTFASGQVEKSVLDRIVPGYYHRLNADGVVERSTCCDNTATENAMMGKLLLDTVQQWASAYQIDSFRFDLMAHQPRNLMEQLRSRLSVKLHRDIQLIGEGWNFGEVADGARFKQASQLSLNGSGIGTFSDRARDAVRGGGPSDGGEQLVANQGYINGLVLAPNAKADPKRPMSDLLRTADMVRVGLAGSLRNYPLQTYTGETKPLSKIDYNGQPAGYVSLPSEVVNYVENHDNQTLFDVNAFKLPLDTSREDRVRVQMLGAAITAFSQGVAYFHAGVDTLRSKSMDTNSYDSGDWFNRIDWTYTDNYFGTGLPPKDDNGRAYALIKPLLTHPQIKPTPADIALDRDMFRDLLRIRASSTLFRLRTPYDIQQRLHFYNVGPNQNGGVIAAKLDGDRYAGANFKALIYFMNVSPTAQTLTIPEEQGQAYQLHPVHRAPAAADKRIATDAKYEAAQGRFSLPPRSAVVFVSASNP